LAFDGDALLVGIDEIGRFDLGGEGGAGGAGGDAAGAGGDAGSLGPDPGAHLQRWSLSGEVLSNWYARGNPRVAIRALDHWFVGETNSFWGSYGAAVEWINASPFGDVLQPFSPVPVQSAGDGEDGAMGLAELDGHILVANCESGLGRIERAGDGGTLEPIRGPWAPTGTGECNPRQLAVVGDVLVTAGSRIDFARVCE
jgi:hypothetical protein